MESVYESLLANKIPKKWQKVSYSSEKTFLAFFDDFCERVKWLQSLSQTNKIPKKYWLSSFFYPRRFLASVKLDFARKHGIELEEITLDFAVVNDER